MDDLFDINTVIALADGEPPERAHVNVDHVVNANARTVHHIYKLLQLLYAQIYLEGKLRCDDYHEGKNSFDDLGETYGYINAYVRQEGGTNTFRFCYRRPLPSGTIFRENLRMNKCGYTRRSFRRAAHEYEVELAMMTEEHFCRLRNYGKTIKKALRSLRSTTYLKL